MILIDANAPYIPYFQSSIPSQGAVQVSEDSTITLKFSQPVKFGTGYIYISNGLNDLRSISVLDTNQVNLNPNGTSEVVIKPSAMLFNNTSYYVQFADGVFTDMDSKPVKGISDTVTIDFKTAPPDTSPPLVLESTPVNNATGVPIYNLTDLTVKFNEPIKPGPGRFIISNGQGDTRTISAYDSTQVLHIYDDTLTFNFIPDLLPNSRYVVQMQDAAVTDSKNNPVVGMFQDQGLHFTTEPPDSDPPIAIISDPLVNAEEVPINSSISAYFNETVMAGNGYITISNGLDDIQKISVTDITFGSNKEYSYLNIRPTRPLQASSRYFVQVDKGAIIDRAGNPYAGIQDQSYTFKTKPIDTTAPTLFTNKIDIYQNHETGETYFSLVFNESILAGTENIVISNHQGDTHTIDIHDVSQVVISGDTLTITLTGNYLPDTEYSVLLNRGVVTDSVGNAFVGITNSAALVFTAFVRDTTPPLLINANLYLDYQGMTYILNPTINIKFNESVKPGTGNFIISNGQNDVRKIAGSDSSQVRISVDHTYEVNHTFGKTPRDYALLEMTPTEPLLAGSQYFVLMETGAVTDLAGNAVDAVLDPQAFTFKTRPSDTTSPDTTPPILNGSYPADDTFIPPYTRNFRLYFNEAIYIGSGLITISNGHNDT